MGEEAQTTLRWKGSIWIVGRWKNWFLVERNERILFSIRKMALLAFFFS